MSKRKATVKERRYKGYVLQCKDRGDWWCYKANHKGRLIAQTSGTLREMQNWIDGEIEASEYNRHVYQ